MSTPSNHDFRQNTVKHMLKFTAKKSFGSVEYSEEINTFAYSPCVTKLLPLFVRVAVTENIRFDLVINRRKFELRDVVSGAAHFLLVVLKITKFEVALIDQEINERDGKFVKTKKVMHTWQITEVAPAKGEMIPFRMFIFPLNLNPSVVDQVNGYSVLHFLNFVVYTTGRQKY